MKIFICYLLFVVSNFLLAQSREEKLQELKNRTDIKITEIEKDILKIEYLNGKVMYKNIGDYKYTESNIQHPVYSPTYDSTIIDLTIIDTTLYYQKYSFWQEVKVGTDNTKPPLVADLNNNGLLEIYGQMKDYTDANPGDNVIMEMNSQGSFDSVYSYDSTSVARAIYDIDTDGRDELLLHRFPPDINYSGQSWLFFKKLSDTSLATELYFIFNPFQSNNSQQNGNKFGDWDGDKFTDQIFTKECCSNIYIYEYNPVLINFDSIYQYDLSQHDLYYEGFAIGDFDMDENTEFFAGSVNGKVTSIENCGDNCYALNWQGMIETNNAYLYAATNDLDSNGKPEVWIGGDHFQDGVGITRITIFEANGNNSYQAVGKIDLIGVFSFYATNMQILDVDEDGKDEVMVCIDQHVIILKFNGSQNHHTYEIFYIKRNDLAFSGRNSVFYGAAMYDVTGDGKEDIIIHMDDIIENVGMRLFTYIYKADFSIDVKEHDHLPEEFNLSQNYPNPFNPTTTIKYDLPKSSVIKLSVYNLLGEEIKLLEEGYKQAGSYETVFNASHLPSGVYICRLVAENYSSSKKMILMK